MSGEGWSSCPSLQERSFVSLGPLCEVRCWAYYLAEVLEVVVEVEMVVEVPDR